MKKISLTIAVIAIIAMLASCGGNKEAENTEKEVATEEVATEVTPDEEAAPEIEEKSTPAAKADWNITLDEYEKFVVSYEKMANDGNITAAPEVKKNADAVAKKIKAAEDQLTAAQIERYKKLNKRLVDASIIIAKKTEESAKETKKAVNGLKDKFGKN